MTGAAFQLARRRGARAAQLEHLRRKTPLDRPVDVFSMVEKAGVWLMFQPLSRLYGAYQRLGDVAGILVNSQHPASLQRFTAAHEYGHHVLGHVPHLDGEESVEARGQTPDEVAAQAFAADFVMPLQLVNRMLRRFNLPIAKPKLSPHLVYRLALELGASYAATVTQLVALKKLTPYAAAQLLKHRPISLKRDLAGARPENARADVWIVEEPQSDRELSPRVDDEVHFLLDEMPSTGFIWSAEIDFPGSDDEGLWLVRDNFEADGGEGELTYGELGRRHLVFSAKRPGSYGIRLVRRRPWESEEASASEVLHFALNAVGRPTGEADRGLVERQKALLAEA
jgi:Zn-dependent peptidase ImmA (M78 family)/predicted secreted protein